jgi:hypothetical protein
MVSLRFRLKRPTDHRDWDIRFPWTELTPLVPHLGQQSYFVTRIEHLHSTNALDLLFLKQTTLMPPSLPREGIQENKVRTRTETFTRPFSVYTCTPLK